MQVSDLPPVSGMVTDDPLAGRREWRLKVHARAFSVEQANDDDQENTGFVSFDAFQGIAGALGFRLGERHHTEGSAVIVHPGIAVTAKHVVEDWLDAFRTGEAVGVVKAAAAGSLLLWRVEKVSVMPTADIGLLSLNLISQMPHEGNFSVAHLSTRMPAVGDTVVLAGFTADAAATEIGDGRFTDIKGIMRVSRGEVVEVWPAGRDRVMLPSASFAVSCPAFGGMSGGAVFDAAGHLIGIVSSALDGDDLSYVSHIWPALIAEIQPVWPPSVPSPTSLLHLGQRHGVIIERPDAFGIDIFEGTVRLVYRPWT